MGARYLTRIGDEEAVVELLGGPEGSEPFAPEYEGEPVRVRIEPAEGEPRELTVDRAPAGDGAWHLLLPDGRGETGHVRAGDKGRYGVSVGGSRLDVVAVPERDAWLGGAVEEQDEGTVTVSMPGKVTKMLVAQGDAVEQGQPVLIVEAMKMENEVKAGRSGVVAKVHVAEGDSVESEVVLMEIGDG